MTSETPYLHVSKNLNISKTKQDIEKLKTPLRLVWKCCSIVFKIGSKTFSLQWHFKQISVFLHVETINKMLQRKCRPHVTTQSKLFGLNAIILLVLA